jgi:hypothetical protein
VDHVEIRLDEDAPVVPQRQPRHDAPAVEAGEAGRAIGVHGDGAQPDEGGSRVRTDRVRSAEELRERGARRVFDRPGAILRPEGLHVGVEPRDPLLVERVPAGGGRGEDRQEPERGGETDQVDHGPSCACSLPALGRGSQYPSNRCGGGEDLPDDPSVAGGRMASEQPSRPGEGWQAEDTCLLIGDSRTSSERRGRSTTCVES